MIRKTTSAVCLLAVLAACSATKPRLQSGKFDVPTAAAKPAASQTKTVALPAERPPAKLFAGSQSVDGMLSRYCTTAGACSELPAGSPRGVSAPQGAPLIFSLSAPPKQARLEVRPSGATTASSQALSPASAMYWSATVGKGSYQLELIATYPQTEVAWRFTLSVTG